MPLSDEYTLGTGLLENENVWFDQATFSYDADYNKGQSLCLVVQARCEDGRTEKVLLPVGDGWEAAPGGNEIRREDGNVGRKVQKQSAYGQFFQSVVDLIPVNPQLGQVLEARPGGARDATTFVGLGFHVIRKEEHFKINGEDRTTQRLLADGFIGTNVNGQSAQAATTPVVAQQAVPLAPAVPLTPVAAPGVALTPPVPVAAPAAAQPVGQPAVATAPPEVVAQLTAIAKASADHSTWMTSAFAVPGVMGNSALEQGIIDQTEAGLFLRLRAS